MLRKALIACFGFLLPLVVGEVYLQLVDPYHFGEKEDWSQYGEEIIDRAANRLRAGAEATYLGKATRLSSRGWRSPEFEVPKPDGVFRVLLLGGSVSFGWGVEQGDEFPRLLERQLNERKVAGDRKIEVINTGVPGWKLLERGKFLIAEGFSYQPDLVLMTLVSTDVPTPAAEKTAKRSALLSEPARRLRLLRAIENRYLFNSPGVGGVRFDHYERISDTGLEQVKVMLGLFAEQCKNHKVPLVIVDTLNKAQTRDRCIELGIPRIEGYTPWSLRRSWEVAATDAHPNAEGHRFYARLILDGLDPRLFERR